MKDLPMRLSLLLPVTFIPAAALAQEEPIVLDPITIYGGLTTIKSNSYGRTNTIITADEINTLGIATVQDALRTVPGISVSSSGEANTQIRIRGAEGNHTLILIDGIRASAGDSEYFLSGLDTANIERIEILRGPQSVFFGADASAGVINIITREGSKGQEARATTEVGNGWSASFYASSRNDRGGISFSANKRNDNGYDLSGDSGGDDDGIRRGEWAVSGDYKLTDTLSVGIKFRNADETFDYDRTSYTAITAEEYLTDSDDYSTRNETAGQFWAELETMDGRLSHRLSYEQTYFETADNGGPASDARTDVAKYRAVYGIDDTVDEASQTISLGLEHRKDENSIAAEQNRRSNSAIIEYRANFINGLDMQLGLRRDNNDVFQDSTTWTLGLSYALPNAPVRIHASAGTGVVNPTYTELFGGFGTIGNPNLRPEENQSFDLGFEVSFLDNRGSLDLTYFHENLVNEITYSGIPLTNGTSYYNQTGSSKRRGVEFSADFAASDSLNFGASYTYLDAKNPDGTIETRRPRHTLGLSTQYLFDDGRGSVAGDLRYVAGNYDTQFYGDFTTKKLPDYVVVNVAAGYDIIDKVRLTGRIENLFNKGYSDVWGYPAEGRTGWLGLQAKW